jgi:uncharacterized alpha-E superfamily protein
MVRDPGWYMLDSGRGLERALQVLALLRVTVCRERSAETDLQVTEAVLSAAESIVTFRRRYRTRIDTEGVVELLVLDTFNPRSVAYQLSRIRHDLLAIPGTSPTARQLRLVDSIYGRLRNADLTELCVILDDRRPRLADFLGALQDRFRELALAIRDQYHKPPPTQQPMLAAPIGDVVP